MQAIAANSASTHMLATTARWSLAQNSDAVDTTDGVRRARHHGRHHHDHHARQAEGLERRHDDDRMRAELRVKIEQTFRQLRSESGSDGEADDDGSRVEATLKARIRTSSEDGRIDARLKISLAWQGEGDATQFNQVLEQFTQTLFGALQTLFGQPAALKDATTSDAPGNDTTAAAAAAAAAATVATSSPPDPTSQAAATSTTGAATAATPAATSTSTSIDSAAQPAATTTSARISIQLRLSYGGFETQVPSLVQRLAQPEIAQQTPALQPMLEDLRSAWARLWGMAAGDGGSAPTLASFFAALGRRYAEPPPVALLPAPMATTGTLISTQA